MTASISLTEALDEIWKSRRPRLQVSEEVGRKLSDRDLKLVGEIERRFTVPALENSEEGQTPSRILAAFQVARDHSDGLAYLPAPERKKRMEEYAQDIGVPITLFIQLCSSWPVIERFIASWED
ncbi:MAG: hypothetical protein ABJF67_06715 [Aurantimonas coralicida]